MRLHGAQGQMELGCDLTVRKAEDDEAEHLLLACRESRSREGRAERAWERELIDAGTSDSKPETAVDGRRPERTAATPSAMSSRSRRRLGMGPTITIRCLGKRLAGCADPIDELDAEIRRLEDNRLDSVA